MMNLNKSCIEIFLFELSSFDTSEMNLNKSCIEILLILLFFYNLCIDEP